MAVRGIRGATTVNQDQAEEILSATRELLSAVLQANPSLQPEDLASAIFTVSDDLSAVYTNPGALTALPGTQVTLGGTWENLHGDFESNEE